MGLIGSDDVLASFIAGNVFNWDDWFRRESEDDSLQPTIDMLLNVAIFMWYGAVCPWHHFVTNPTIPIYRLIFLGVLVLLFRRLPMILAFYWYGSIHQLADIRQTLFAGFFGPIGVSAIFYLYISREFMRDSPERPDFTVVSEAIEIVVWFLVICSIVVHGLVIPVAKLGLYLPRTFSTAISTERISASQSRARSGTSMENDRQQPPVSQRGRTLPFHQQTSSPDEVGPPLSESRGLHWLPASFITAGKKVMNDIRRPTEDPSPKPERRASFDNTFHGSSESSPAHPEISMPTNPRPLTETVSRATGQSDAPVHDAEKLDESTSSSGDDGGGPTAPAGIPPRSIQFADQSGGARNAAFEAPTSK